ncbi:HemK2/MTQ2 family protein methyltransferase [Tomitella fengzijianii]|nr:HemK2/MTQ2 family protein methyltransferase [Tomitella fengzijianii]
MGSDGGDNVAQVPRVLRLPGVYRPQEDTALLVEAVRGLRMTADTAVLDVCTGSGAVALAAASAGSRNVTAVDISLASVWSARCNAWLRGYRCLDVRRADITGFRFGGRFNLIVCNPPYVPTPSSARTRGADRAWNAGPSGRALLDPLCRSLPSMLADGGRLLMVQSECADIDRTVAELAQRCADARVVARRRIPFGRIMSDRTGYLGGAGLLPDLPDGRNTPSEEIAVIEAVAAVRWPALEPAESPSALRG